MIPGSSNITRDELVGAGLSSLFLSQLKMNGWLPIEEYFKIRTQEIELDWVLVLTMENNGFISIPRVAEFCIPAEGTSLKPGWYGDDMDNPFRRIDDYTNVIAFKLLEDKPSLDKIRENILNEYYDKENIKNYDSYSRGFNDTVIKLCKGSSEHLIEKLKNVKDMK